MFSMISRFAEPAETYRPGYSLRGWEYDVHMVLHSVHIVLDQF